MDQKKDSDNNFDVTQERFDEAEVCEYVWVLLLHQSNGVIDIRSHSLYSDDSLVLIENVPSLKVWYFGKETDTHV